MTLKEVARLAGVSPSAVSRYLNGGSLSETKRCSIAQAIEETGYRPNQAARTLRTGSLKQVGIIVPKINSSSVSQVTAGIHQVLAERGYLPLVGSTERMEEREALFLDLMQSNHVAGIILMGSTMTPEKAAHFHSCQVPLVITGQNFPGFPCVYHDDYHAIKELTKLLICRGRKKIVYLGVPEIDPATGRDRRRGVEDALEEAGLNGKAMPRTIGDYTMESGRECMARLLEEHPDLDGVICATDTIAHGAMMTLQALGRRIPEDVSIAGVGNNTKANQISRPNLTSAVLYHEACGRDAAEILLRMIEGQEEHPPRRVALGYTIVERGSI